MKIQYSKAPMIIVLVMSLSFWSAAMAQEEGKSPDEPQHVLASPGELQWRDGPLPLTQLVVEVAAKYGAKTVVIKGSKSS